MNRADKIIQRIESVEIKIIMFILAFELFIALLAIIVKVFGELQLLQDFHKVFLNAALLWVGFLGASLAISKHKNIAIDIIFPIIRGKNKRKILQIVDFFSSIISFILFLLSYYFVKDLLSSPPQVDSSYAFINKLDVYVRFVYPLMFLVFSFKFIVSAFQSELLEKGEIIIE